AASTVRSLTEQTTAIEQISKETDRLVARFGNLAKSMAEQARSSQEITAAASDLDQQSREASRAMKEQATGFKQITEGSANIAKQIKLIAASNLENTRSTTVVLDRIEQVRQVARKNGESAQSIRRIVMGNPEAAKGRNGKRSSGTSV